MTTSSPRIESPSILAHLPTLLFHPRIEPSTKAYSLTNAFSIITEFLILAPDLTTTPGPITTLGPIMQSSAMLAEES